MQREGRVEIGPGRFHFHGDADGLHDLGGGVPAEYRIGQCVAFADRDRRQIDAMGPPKAAAAERSDFTRHYRLPGQPRTRRGAMLA